MSEDKRTFHRKTNKVADEAVVENPTAPTAAAEPLKPLEVSADTVTTPAPVVAPSGQISREDFTKQSPVEDKIHAIKTANVPEITGWENKMIDAPQTGERIMVSKDGKDQGILVYWRVSKFVDKAKLRYVAKGRWTEFLTKKDIEFVPSYWKKYDPEEYWPLRGSFV